MDPDVFEYVVDANDVIVSVNDSWKAFAVENGGADLGDRVLGTWLWQHMAGIEVKHLFRILLERVRASGTVVRVPFRCDAPELRRSMVLEVTPLPGGAVRFVSWIEEEEGRPKIHLLEAGRPEASDRFVRLCAWCKRIATSGSGEDQLWIGDGGARTGRESGTAERWIELEDALTELGLLSQNPLPKINHGVCFECQTRVMSELEPRF